MTDDNVAAPAPPVPGAVPLAGVPETPIPASGEALGAAAVPSTDFVATEASPNLDTSNVEPATRPNGTSAAPQPAAVATPSGAPVPTDDAARVSGE